MNTPAFSSPQTLPTGLKRLPGDSGLASVEGFRYSGVSADIRQKQDGRLDLALIASDRPCQAAGVFTQHDVPAAPVLLSREHLQKATSHQAIITNSGNANACTGADGMEDARQTCQQLARLLQLPESSVLVCSTGRIGRALPMPALLGTLPQAVQALGGSKNEAQAAAKAILTSDTRPKMAACRIEHAGRTATIAGFAKGAGMIQPNMATMLAFIVTDLAVPRALLEANLHRAVNLSFNRISIDGDTSTNDTVLALANGASALHVDGQDNQLLILFQSALDAICRDLAFAIVADGERITRVVELVIRGARDDQAAEKVARTIANSLLVKTSWFGGDPNWGRLVDAAGYAGAGIDFSRLDIFYGTIPAVLAGCEQSANLPQWRSEVNQRQFTITLDLHAGEGTCNLLTTDLSTGYVDFNKSE